MTQFNLNCTLPLTIVNYVDQPNTRGTFDILWACLTSTFLCTYSIQHPNVPIHERTHSKKATSSKLLTLVSPQCKDLDVNNSQMKATNLITATKIGCEKALPISSITSMTTSKTFSNSTTAVQRRKEAASTSDKSLCRIITLRENSLPDSNGKNSFLVKEVIADLRRRIFSGEDTGFSFTSLVDHLQYNPTTWRILGT